MQRHKDVIYPYRPQNKQIDETKVIIRSNYRECSFVDGEVTTKCYKVDEEHYSTLEYMDKITTDNEQLKLEKEQQWDTIDFLLKANGFVPLINEQTVT